MLRFPNGNITHHYCGVENAYDRSHDVPTVTIPQHQRSGKRLDPKVVVLHNHISPKEVNQLSDEEIKTQFEKIISCKAQLALIAGTEKGKNDHNSRVIYACVSDAVSNDTILAETILKSFLA